MPELPEVESVRRGLGAVLGARVVGVRVRRRDVLVVPGDPMGGWSRQGSERPRARRYTGAMLLDGCELVETARRGKRMALIGRPEGGARRAIEIGLGMTGWVRILRPREHTPEHAHLIWRLDDGRRIAFVDARRFGGVWAWETEGDLRAHWEATLGPDALTVTGPTLRVRLSRASRPLKAALLDQRVVAGVGNIYADESCFRAGILPHAMASELSGDRVTRLAGSLRAILRDAIREGGSTLRDFRDAEGSPGGYQHGHLVYGRGGEPCSVCGRALSRATVAQRTSVWCDSCQTG
ncbi:MAG: Fpg/Nei family DNA glycosylase [Phycisphaerales bacterium JB040]